MRICSLVACLMFLFGSNVIADSVQLTASQDTSIYSDNTDFSNGSGDFFFAGQNGSSSQRRGLIRFDLSMIPDNAIVTNVTLNLVATQVSTTDPSDVSFHRLLADWGESTSDANGGEGGGAAAAPGDATWNESFFGSQNWANPGGDFAMAASATTSVSTTGAYSWSSPGLTNDVQSWLDGTHSNYGWLAIGDETNASTAKRFNSRSNGSNNPTLIIEFTSIPEPSTAAIIGLVSIAWLTKRRRRSSDR